MKKVFLMSFVLVLVLCTLRVVTVHAEEAPPNSPELSAEEWLRKGQIFEADKQFEQSLDAYENVYRLMNRYDPKVQASISIARLSLEYRNHYGPQFEIIIPSRDSARLAELYILRGKAYIDDLLDYVQAFKDFNKALELNPDMKETYKAEIVEIEKKAEKQRLADANLNPNNREELRSAFLNKIRMEKQIVVQCENARPKRGEDKIEAQSRMISYTAYFNSYYPSSKMSLEKCSGDLIIEGVVYSFSGGGLVKWFARGIDFDLTSTYPAEGTLIHSVVSATQPGITAQITIRPEGALITDITLPGMDAGGAMLMNVGGKNITVTANALIAYLNNHYANKHFNNSIMAFGNSLIGDNVFRRDVLAGFTPETTPKKKTVKTKKKL